MSDDALDKVSLDMSIRNIKTLYVGVVTKIHNRNGKTDSRILFIGDSCISFFTDKQNPSESRTFYWVDLIDVDFSGDKFEFQFSKNQELMKFTSPDSEEIKEIIGFLLHRYLTDEERKIIQLEQFGKFEGSPTGLMMLARFNSHVLSNKMKPSPDIISFVTEIFRKKPSEIEITDLNFGPYIPALIYAINLIPFATSIIIPDLNPPIYQILTKTVQEMKTINHLYIMSANFKAFPDFCNAINILDKTSPITGISYVDVPFTQKQLTQLHDSIIARGFRSFSMQNCINEKISNYFYNDFLDSRIMNTIEMLNLDFTSNINLTILIPKATGLVSLSLESTGVDIFEVFTQLSSGSFPKLEFINLKGNVCTKSIGSIKLDDNIPLSRIDARKVQWKASCFSGMFKFIAARNWKNGLSLDMSLAQYEELDFQDMITFVGGIQEGPLIHLSWSKNPINHEFIEFLKKNPKLYSINITSCFKQGTLSQMQEFGEFINESNIQYLTMAGHGKDTIGEDMDMFFQKLVNPRSLYWLDIRNQKIGVNGLESLGTVIENTPSLRIINFSGANMKKLEELFGFFNRVRAMQRPLKFDFPDDDMQSIMSEHVFKQEEFTKLRWLLNDIAKGGRSVPENDNEVIRRLENDPLDVAFDEFKMESPYTYPLFMKPNMTLEMRKGNNPRNTAPHKDATIVSTIDVDIYSEQEEDYEVTEEEDKNDTDNPFFQKVTKNDENPFILKTEKEKTSKTEEKPSNAKDDIKKSPKKQRHHQRRKSVDYSDEYDYKIDTRYNRKRRGSPYGMPYPYPYAYPPPPPYYAPPPFAYPPPYYMAPPPQQIQPQIQYQPQQQIQQIQQPVKPIQSEFVEEVEDKPVKKMKQRRAPELVESDGSEGSEIEKPIKKKAKAKPRKIDWTFPVDKLHDIDIADELANIDNKFSFKNLVNDIMGQ